MLPPTDPPTDGDPTITSTCKATGWGDPHFVTFDGLKYDCQANGEVVLLKSLISNFEIQGRFSLAGSDVTVTTGVVVRESGDETTGSSTTPIIQVSMATTDATSTPATATTLVGCPVMFYVDGSVQDLSSLTSGEFGGNFAGVIITIPSSNTIVISYPSTDLRLEMTVSSFRNVCYFSVDYYLRDEYCKATSSEQLVGLLGSPNNNKDDDWMTMDGTALPIPEGFKSLIYEPAYDYCTANWCLRDASLSLFTYEAGTTFNDFANCDMPYVGSTETAIDNAPSCLRELCQNDLGCLVDAVTLGPGAAEAYISNPASNITSNTNDSTACTPSQAKPCYFSCAEAMAVTCDTEPKLYDICPDGGADSYSVYCDQETDGGGWMLLYSYKHVAGDNAELVPNTIPQDPNDDYSHFHVIEIPGYTVEDIESVRFYCTTSNHDRIIHFKNTDENVLQIAYTGDSTNNDPSFWNNECVSSEYSGHTAGLPAETTTVHRSTENGFAQFPFWLGFAKHWGIRAQDFFEPRFECDDFLGNGLEGIGTDTLHNVWVKIKKPVPEEQQPTQAPTVATFECGGVQTSESIDIVIAIDESESMENEQQAVKDHVSTLFNRIDQETNGIFRISLVGFTGPNNAVVDPELKIRLTNDQATFEEAVQNLVTTKNSRENGRGTLLAIAQNQVMDSSGNVIPLSPTSSFPSPTRGFCALLITDEANSGYANFPDPGVDAVIDEYNKTGSVVFMVAPRFSDGYREIALTTGGTFTSVGDFVNNPGPLIESIVETCVIKLCEE